MKRDNSFQKAFFNLSPDIGSFFWAVIGFGAGVVFCYPLIGWCLPDKAEGVVGAGIGSAAALLGAEWLRIKDQKERRLNFLGAVMRRLVKISTALKHFEETIPPPTKPDVSSFSIKLWDELLKLEELINPSAEIDIELSMLLRDLCFAVRQQAEVTDECKSNWVKGTELERIANVVKNTRDAIRPTVDLCMRLGMVRYRWAFM